MTRSKILLIASTALCASNVHAANIIDSIHGIGAGSFENPGHTIPTFETYQAGSTAITGWTVNTTNIDWVRKSVWNASQGNYSLDMNGTPGGPGGIQTVIPTTAGSTYRVTFDIAGFLTAGSSTNPKVMQTSAGGVDTLFSLVATESYSQPFTLSLAVTWSTRSFNFVATSASSTIVFTSLTANDGSAMLLDNVSMEAVPEPTAAALLGAGMIGFALRRKRQFRSPATF